MQALLCRTLDLWKMASSALPLIRNTFSMNKQDMSYVIVRKKKRMQCSRITIQTNTETKVAHGRKEIVNLNNDNYHNVKLFSPHLCFILEQWPTIEVFPCPTVDVVVTVNISFLKPN